MGKRVEYLQFYFHKCVTCEAQLSYLFGLCKK